jgi:hypothetical protein
VSQDGTKAVYTSYGGLQSRQLEVRLHDFSSGTVSTFPARDMSEQMLHPRLSRDGTLLTWKEKEVDTYLVKPGERTSTSKRVCSECAVLDFFAGGDLLVRYEAGQLVRQRQDSVQQTLLASAGGISDAALSPDDRWLALLLPGTQDNAIRLASVRAPLAPESEWITLAKGPELLLSPRWSPDGRLVYYLSDRDGHECIWAQRVDAATKKPAGEPFAVLHEHRARYRLNQLGVYGQFGVGNGRLVYWMAENNGNIRKTKVDLKEHRLFGIF